MFSNFFHLYRIGRVLIRHNLDALLQAITLPKPMIFALKIIPTSWRGDQHRQRGARLREALQELGPVFVKFGQMLSTRPDLLPADIHIELTKLQDEVPPFSGSVARQTIEAAYGDRIEDHFSYFETESTASASVAQIHYARMLDQKQVVVKVLRPDIQKVIERDVALLKNIAALLERYSAEALRLKPMEVVADYENIILGELDLMQEAANASQLRANFADSDLIYVPQVYFDHCRRNVMVMERVYGIPIRDIEQIKAAGIDLRKLAHDGVEIFFTQAFRDGFFHADMHPGNIFVADNGQYRAVDFGIMGTLDDADKRYLAENLLGFFNRDYRAVAAAHIRAGWVPANTRADQFETAIRTVCEPIFAKPISEISFGTLLINLFRIAGRFQMPVQPQLLLLQKTLLNIEGIGRQLYAELDLWDTAKPFLERWMKQQIGAQAAFKAMRRELPNLATLAPELPTLAHQLLARIKNDQLIVQTRDHAVAQLQQQLRASARRTRRLIAGFGLILLAAILAPTIAAGYQNVPTISWLLGVAGVGLIAVSWWR